jgi:hypothetical protein
MMTCMGKKGMIAGSKQQFACTCMPLPQQGQLACSTHLGALNALLVGEKLARGNHCMVRVGERGRQA